MNANRPRLGSSKAPLIDLDMQCWLLSACCALYPEEFSSYPELQALRRAIKDRQPAAIALGLEVACSHLAGQLTPRQLRLSQRLAEEVRRGSMSCIRRTTLALLVASLGQRQQAS